MNIHKNARLTPHGRAEVIRQVALGRSARRVGRDAAVSGTTVLKWVRRALAGEPLADRSCRPHRSPHTTPPAIVLRIEVLRRERRTCAEIARAVGVSRATVARIVSRHGWSRLHVLEADWQSVASPERIQRLAQAKLGINDATTLQLTSFENLPVKGADAPLNNTPIQQASIQVPTSAPVAASLPAASK